MCTGLGFHSNLWTPGGLRRVFGVRLLLVSSLSRVCLSGGVDVVLQLSVLKFPHPPPPLRFSVLVPLSVPVFQPVLEVGVTVGSTPSIFVVVHQ